MIQTDLNLTAGDLRGKIGRMWELSGAKIRHLEAHWRPEDGAPVYTMAGRYVTQGWTEWTQGFQFGIVLAGQWGYNSIQGYKLGALEPADDY